MCTQVEDLENLRTRLIAAGDAARHLYRSAEVREEDLPWWDQLLASVLAPPTHTRYGNIIETGAVVWATDFAAAEEVQRRFGFPIALEHADGA